MSANDQHHQHHKEEHEHERKEKRDHERKLEQQPESLQPLIKQRWFLILGVLLTLGVILVWTLI